MPKSSSATLGVFGCCANVRAVAEAPAWLAAVFCVAEEVTGTDFVQYQGGSASEKYQGDSAVRCLRTRGHHAFVRTLPRHRPLSY